MVRIGLEGAWLEVASHKSSAYARQGVGPYIAWTIAIDGKDAIVAYGKHEAKGMAVRMVEDMLGGSHSAPWRDDMRNIDTKDMRDVWEAVSTLSDAQEMLRFDLDKVNAKINHAKRHQGDHEPVLRTRGRGNAGREPFEHFQLMCIIE